MSVQIGPSSPIQVSAHVTMYPKDSDSFATYSCYVCVFLFCDNKISTIKLYL
ncbi:LOW QUALITY PROTEIN: hypothetical protein PanWU01x14_205510 [Parasponia andersonii]|uniref:Uncharacterized protein n=1 Tax=Parasponia andersonii TaxID=3476 RepID=A0A2P5BW46_PARAD|nr:LOW QUALITY PROTEIN: hypothetical protein PanWU01x14_205510 [Parasponia andersonii]